jgi:hypothetical protein
MTRIFVIQVSSLRRRRGRKAASPAPRHIDRDQGEDFARADSYADRVPPREGKTLVMASGTKTRSEARAAASALCSAAKGAALGAVPAAIGSQAAILRTRRGQTLGFNLPCPTAHGRSWPCCFPAMCSARISYLRTRRRRLPRPAQTRFGGCGLPRSTISPLPIRQSRAISIRPWQASWRARLSMSPRSASSIASRGWQPCWSSWPFVPA